MADAIVADIESSGIYQIRNLVNGKRYVGSAIRFSKRWSEHRRDLDKGKHHSIALQRAWERYGGGAFVFEILEKCSPDSLLSREQFYIDERSDYNICKVAGSPLGVKRTAETRAKLSARLMGNQRTKGRKYSREICERMAAPKRGRKLPPRSAEWCRRISEAKKGKSVGLGREVSEETRQKLREANLGKRLTLEQRKNDVRLSLTDDDAERILLMRLSGASFKQISKDLGVSRQTAQRVCARQRYEWVRPDIVIPSFRRTGWKVEGRRRGVIRWKNGTCK